MFRPAVALALLAASATAFDVLAPGPDVWWVASGTNLLVWECNALDVQPLYTVFATNPDTNILTDRTPLIANLDNTQCSHQITPGEVAPLKPATGYVIQLTDPINNTHILGQSQPFEVKAAGSAYSTVTKTPKPRTESGDQSSTSAGAGSSPTSKPDNGAAKTGASALAALGAVALGMLVMA